MYLSIHMASSREGERSLQVGISKKCPPSNHSLLVKNIITVITIVIVIVVVIIIINISTSSESSSSWSCCYQEVSTTPCWSGTSLQRCKKRQIWQICLCYFFWAGANFWTMHAYTSAIITSAINTNNTSTSAINTSAISNIFINTSGIRNIDISTNAINTSAISTSYIITSAIYFCMMSLGET